MKKKLVTLRKIQDILVENDLLTAKYSSSNIKLQNQIADLNNLILSEKNNPRKYKIRTIIHRL